MYGVSERYELLFQFIIETCHFLGMTAHQFIFVTALLIFVPLYIFVSKRSVNPCFSALIYITFSVTFFGMTFNGVRQAIAMAFSLYSIYYLDKKILVKGIIFFVIAVLFHYSCLVLAPFLILFYSVHSIGKKLLYSVLIGSFCFGLSFGQNAYFLQFFQYFELISDSAVASNYLQYADESNVASRGIISVLGIMLPFMMYSIFLYDSKNKSSLAYTFIVTGAVLSNIFISIHYMYRMAAYFILPILYVLPETQERTKGYKYYALCVLNAIMLLWYFYSLLKAGPESANGIFPYSTFL